MKKLLFILSLSPLFALGQTNLVPNPSFEIYSSCPGGPDEVFKATSWSSFRGSPDYFNVCATSSLVTVPDNMFSYQMPASGNTYCGLYGYWIASLYREYIGAPLNSALLNGQKYFVSFKVNKAAKPGATMANDKLGVLFSTVPYSVSSPTPINNFAHVYTTSIITDTTNWTRIFDSFIADSAYQYIIIGNFFDDANTDTMSIGPSPFRGYYFIDDVCVSTDSLLCATFTESINEPEKEDVKIFPCPTSGQVSIKFLQSHNKINLVVQDLMGREIINKNITNNNADKLDFNLSGLSNGVYLLNISMEDISITNKIIINH